MALKLTLGRDDVFITSDGMVAQVTSISRKASGQLAAQISIVAPSTTKITRIMSSDNEEAVNRKLRELESWDNADEIFYGVDELIP